MHFTEYVYQCSRVQSSFNHGYGHKSIFAQQKYLKYANMNFENVVKFI